ncbi:DNA methyltransferase [Sunxiuqinia rutila]|uniref:DNA methyltransferase n=1 Tax=Sunxiuqinia rutila TaxID=1397841 RepID=UPI003D36A4EC
MFEKTNNQPVTVLGLTFNSEEERREHFRNELRKKLPELKQMEGFPIGEDEDIIKLSDPPYYTACPNPWLNDFISDWEKEKKQLEKEGKRSADFTVDEPYASDVSEGKNNPFYSLHTYHTKVPHPAIMRYLLHYTEPGDIVFDGFAGTGMTGVAAKQCGNADNALKTRLTLEYTHSHNSEPRWGERHAIVSDLAPSATFISANLNSQYDTHSITKNINEKLAKLYKKYKWMYETRHTDGSLGRIDFVVWSEVTQCPECNHEFVLWDEMADTNKGRMKKEFNCSNCSSLLSKNSCSNYLISDFDNHINQVLKSKKYFPVLVKYTTNRKSYYKKPDDFDLKVNNQIIDLTINNWIPISRLPEGDESRRNDKYGMTHVHHFYTKRNLIFISELWSQLNLQEKFVATSILSRNLTKLNRYVLKPRTPHGEVNGPLSGTLYVSSEYVEQNPFDLLKSKIPKFSWNNSGVVTSTNPAQSNIIADNSVDYIFTDPPFGANIMYSELNFIWESWLGVFTDNKPEAIENSTQNKTTLVYQNIMHECFKEYHRILKPGKWMTVEFSNTSAAVWNGIQTAIQNSGFIVANVAALDKKHGGIKSMTYTTAVKQDLIISCYKPSSEFDEKFKQNQNSDVAVWDFVDEHLHHLPIHLAKENATTAIIERSPKILFDRLISFYVQKGLPVPIDAGRFQQDLRERFIERDGMFFTSEQVQEYDKKKAEAPTFIQLSLLVSSEQDGVYWLKNLLRNNPLTYQDIQPQWMQALAGVRTGDIIPELATILDENFLKDDSGKWYLPDPENEVDLEKLRNKRLLKQFESYKTEAFKPRGKIKEVRVESLRAGFKQCYQDKDFRTIVQVGERIPNNLLMEDEVLLQFYDIASSKV